MAGWMALSQVQRVGEAREDVGEPAAAGRLDDVTELPAPLGRLEPLPGPQADDRNPRSMPTERSSSASARVA